MGERALATSVWAGMYSGIFCNVFAHPAENFWYLLQHTFPSPHMATKPQTLLLALLHLSPVFMLWLYLTHFFIHFAHPQTHSASPGATINSHSLGVTHVAALMISRATAAPLWL